MSMLFQSARYAAWLGLYNATYWYLGLLADSLINGQLAQPEFFILLARFTSSWRPAVSGPMVFYPSCGCSLILHTRPAKAMISLCVRAV